MYRGIRVSDNRNSFFFSFPGNEFLRVSLAGDTSVSRGLSLEKKIEALESLAGQVSNRRSRRWLNDRILMELVPRLDAQEIRGLFAPPPWGDDVPPSAFSLTNVGEWDKFRNIDMDKEVTYMSFGTVSQRRSARYYISLNIICL
jgi:hypothetical protein